MSITHKHDVQFIRCRCGLSFDSFRQWQEHFKYREILLGSQQPSQDQIDQLIKEHSGVFSK